MQQLLGQLLVPGDPPPFSLYNETGKAPLLLLCDHASKAIPKALGDLATSAGTSAASMPRSNSPRRSTRRCLPRAIRGW
jgi:hypothetical protein